MQYRTAIITFSELPDDTSDTLDEDGNLASVYVKLGGSYAELRRVDIHTAVNASTLPGPIEDHVSGFERVTS
jgi:hypothetical protein